MPIIPRLVERLPSEEESENLIIFWKKWKYGNNLCRLVMLFYNFTFVKMKITFFLNCLPWTPWRNNKWPPQTNQRVGLVLSKKSYPQISDVKILSRRVIQFFIHVHATTSKKWCYFTLFFQRDFISKIFSYEASTIPQATTAV